MTPIYICFAILVLWSAKLLRAAFVEGRPLRDDERLSKAVAAGRPRATPRQRPSDLAGRAF